jgi:hypothetical protein
MIEPAFFPSLTAKDDSAERFCRIVDRLRQEQRRGDDRANFALMALSVVETTFNVSHGFMLVDPRAGSFAKGRFVTSAGGRS